MTGEVNKQQVVVIGAGPAGLAAAYDLAGRGMAVTCLEADGVVGGISRTILHNGFRFDIGGHRFFSRYRRVNALWQEVLGEDFLVRPRLSRILYNGHFFNYPLKPMNALMGLGPVTAVAVLGSYLHARLFPLRPEETFDRWVRNRFGERLYAIFFKTYTEKVWGIPCAEIQAEWAAQRIKGLSLAGAIKNALLGAGGEKIPTLIDRFHYPRLGPGQMYEAMAAKAQAWGARLCLDHGVVAICHDGHRLASVQVRTPAGRVELAATDFISTMPITELILRLRPEPPAAVTAAARSLRYRSLLTVNLLCNTPQELPDTWIYIHDPSVRMGRVQCFANWSPAMVPGPEYSSLGLEYFCSEGDELWGMTDAELLALGKAEIARLGLLGPEAVFDGFVVRMAKCYPVYDRAYAGHLATIREYLRTLENVQLCGRYGLFKYNNMDHSILTALLAVENILGARHDLWSINADDQYQEEGA